MPSRSVPEDVGQHGDREGPSEDPNSHFRGSYDRRAPRGLRRVPGHGGADDRGRRADGRHGRDARRRSRTSTTTRSTLPSMPSPLLLEPLMMVFLGGLGGRSADRDVPPDLQAGREHQVIGRRTTPAARRSVAASPRPATRLDDRAGAARVRAPMDGVMRASRARALVLGASSCCRSWERGWCWHCWCSEWPSRRVGVRDGSCGRCSADATARWQRAFLDFGPALGRRSAAGAPGSRPIRGAAAGAWTSCSVTCGGPLLGWQGYSIFSFLYVLPVIALRVP